MLIWTFTVWSKVLTDQQSSGLTLLGVNLGHFKKYCINFGHFVWVENKLLQQKLSKLKPFKVK